MKYLLISVAIALVGYIAYRMYRYMNLTEGLEKKIAQGAIILDVRTAVEYRTGHINGSINIPLGEIRERYVELDPTSTYITTCSHGLRSVKVESLLRERGFSQVYNGGPWNDLEKVIPGKR